MVDVGGQREMSAEDGKSVCHFIQALLFLTRILTPVLSISISRWLTKDLLSLRQILVGSGCASLHCEHLHGWMAWPQFVQISIFSRRCSVSMQHQVPVPAALSPSPRPSKCPLLSKNLISQMEKQHLLSCSLTYGSHSCSYELKQVKGVGELAQGDPKQRAWPWGPQAAVQLEPLLPEPDKSAYEMRPCRAGNHEHEAKHWRPYICCVMA